MSTKAQRSICSRCMGDAKICATGCIMKTELRPSDLPLYLPQWSVQRLVIQGLPFVGSISTEALAKSAAKVHDIPVSQFIKTTHRGVARASHVTMIFSNDPNSQYVKETVASARKFGSLHFIVSELTPATWISTLDMLRVAVPIMILATRSKIVARNCELRHGYFLGVVGCLSSSTRPPVSNTLQMLAIENRQLREYYREWFDTLFMSLRENYHARRETTDPNRRLSDMASGSDTLSG